jgi:hypothetical protein
MATNFRNHARQRAMGLVLSALLSVPALAGIGDIDPLFGIGGRLDFPMGFAGLAALPDGRLQLLAIETGKVRVLRLDSNGRPDPGFGVAGILETPISLDSTYKYTQVQETHVLKDGGAYVHLNVQYLKSDPFGGGIYRSEARLLRIGSSGRTDEGFGPGGARDFPVSKVTGTRYSFISDYAVASDGGLYVLVGYYDDSYDCAMGMFIYRLNPDGERDTGFGTGGEYLVDTNNNCYWGAPFQLVPLDGGRLLLNSASPLLLDAQGRIGTLPVAWQTWLQAHGETLIFEADDYLYTVNASTGSQLHAIVARWRRDLSQDNTFGAPGTGISEFNVEPLPFVPASVEDVMLLAPKSANEFLYVGLTALSGLYAPSGAGSERRDSAQTLVRLQPGGALDRTFGVDGVVQATVYVGLSPVQQQPDGSLVVGVGSRAMRLSGASRASPGLVVPDSCDYGNSFGEKAGARLVRIWRTLGSQGPVTIGFHTFGRGATPGADYTDVSGTLSWADGESGARTISVPILDDSVFELDEDFDIVFEGLAGDAVSPCAKIRMVIQSDDSAPVVPVPQPAPTLPPVVQGDSGGGGSLGLAMIGLLGSLLLMRSGRRAGRHFPPRSRLTVRPTLRPSP